MSSQHYHYRPAFVKPLLLLTTVFILGVGAYLSWQQPSDATNVPGQIPLEENLTAISTLLIGGNTDDDPAYCRILNRRFTAAKQGFDQMLKELNAFSARKIDSNLSNVKSAIDEECF
jgi:hypothetical protein